MLICSLIVFGAYTDSALASLISLGAVLCRTVKQNYSALQPWVIQFYKSCIAHLAEAVMIYHETLNCMQAVLDPSLSVITVKCCYKKGGVSLWCARGEDA